jgi:protein phosphatase
MRAAGTDGADRAHAGMMHVITRAITTRHHFDPDTRIERIEEGDRFLLSSDGLTDVLSEEEVARVLAATPEPEVASKALVEKAYAAGSTDNITAVVVTT